MLCFKTISSPIGSLTLTEEDGVLCRLDFGRVSGLAQAVPGDSPLLALAESQLREYFAGGRREFSIPFALSGTPFQQKVWAELAKIPYGTVCTYGDLARAIGKPQAFRAVGGANHRNPISIIVPCHRVIGQDHSLTGYGGGLQAKEFLLKLEGVTL